MAVGEGWHNYHHVFPWDYKAAELGKYSTNISTGFIDLCAKIGKFTFNWFKRIHSYESSRSGWAYDMKTVSSEMVKKRVLRTGDGTHPYSQESKIATALQDHHHDSENAIWGWDDNDMTEEERGYVEYSYKKEE
jgi:stearoyl-CoA desaturase (Delta-9 desaturase)